MEFSSAIPDKPKDALNYQDVVDFSHRTMGVYNVEFKAFSLHFVNLITTLKAFFGLCVLFEF